MRDPISPAELVEAGLAEDLGDGDRTVTWTVPDGARGVAHIISRAHGVLYGIDLASLTFETVDPELRFEARLADGSRVVPDQVIARVSGSLGAILGAERTALNFLGRLSGVATLASRYVEAVGNADCRIADTRKTTPGWRALEKAAAAAGGAMNHRAGLYDMVLIKENHIRASGGVREALEGALEGARAENLEVEIEVTDLVELEEALMLGPDRILLDNMSLDQLRSAAALAIRSAPPRPLLEASGGITLDTVRSVAETGVDYISVGAITHSAPALDLSLQVVES